MRIVLINFLILLMLAGCDTKPEPVKTVDALRKPQVLAPGYAELNFDAPEPGSYELPPISGAKDAVVLDEDGEAVNLHELYDDKIVLLSFIYSTCTDVNGCPLATAVFHKIKNRLQNEDELTDKLQLISLSFDPQNDTPEVMKLYGQGFQDENIDWRFLTPESEQTLTPILDDYYQSINKEYDQDGNALSTFSHVLHVYLIDSNQMIRNIYSVSFLHPDILIADIKTLLMEQRDAQASVQPAGTSRLVSQ